MAWLFVGTLVATTLVDLVAPLDAPRPVGPEAVRDAELRAGARWADGTRARLVERDAQLTSRVRSALGPAHAALAVGVLGQTPPSVLRGGDGWLFLRSETVFDTRRAERTVERAAALVAAFERRVAAQGARFIALPVPRKATVVPEVAPRGVELRPELEDRLLDALRRRGVEALDVRPALAALPREERFYRYDMHWTMHARRAVAEALARHVGVLAPAPSTTLVARTVRPAPSGTLRMAGIHDDSPLRAFFPQREHTVYGVEPLGAGPGVGSVTDRMPRLAHFGSSFSGEVSGLYAHFADQDVFGSGQSGGILLEPLGNLRQAYNFGRWPEVVSYEFPLSVTLDKASSESLALTAAQGFALSILPLTPTAPLEVAGAAPRDEARLAIPEGRLVTTGDGVAAVRVARAGGGAGVGLWRIDSDGVRAEVPWHAQRAHVLLPVLDAEVLGAAVRVVPATPDAAAAAVVAEVVTDLDLAAAVPGAVVPNEGRSAAVAALVRFDGPTVTRHSGLVCALDLGAFEGEVELVARTREGGRAGWRARVARQATVVLDLSALAGGALQEFEVRAPGAPTCRVSSPRFAPQARVASQR